MRRLIAFAAVLGMAAAPMAALAADETADIYSKNGISGPSFARATQCTAMFSVALNAVPEGSADYDMVMKIATGWLRWSKHIADGRDAEGEIGAKAGSFKDSLAGYSPEDASAALTKQTQACTVIKSTMAGLQPFTSVYNGALTGDPDFYAATDCVANYSVVSELIGKDDKNYKFYTKGLELWATYVSDIYGGDEKLATQAATDRATVITNELVALLNSDGQAGLDRIASDRANCVDLEAKLPKYFKGRKGPA